MTKRLYTTPSIRVSEMLVEPFMNGSSDETLPFDPGDGTEDALSKGNSFWDDNTTESVNNDPFEE